MSPAPPVYDLPYADRASHDQVGFKSLGKGYVTQYNTVDDDAGTVASYAAVLDDASVKFYCGAEEASH